MNIQLNGETEEISDSLSLNELIKEKCHNNPRVVAEINGKIVPAEAWELASFKEGDKVELVTFVGGG